MGKSIILLKKDFGPGPSTLKFTFLENGEKKTGFALLFEGSYYVYKNQCQHLPVELDWLDNNFLEDDGGFIICATHGAIYEPTSGLCVSGPCKGKSLNTMAYTITRDELVVNI